MRSLVAMLCLLSFPVRADCMDWSWHVFPPPGTTLPTNGRVTLQATGRAREALETISKRHPRLVAGAIEVPLKVVERHVGDFEVSQAVLQAKGALTEGTRYTLRFDDTDTDFRFINEKSASWTVTPADFTPPTWRSGPSPWPGRHVEYGCGPSHEARVGLVLADDNATQVRARVTGSDGGTREFLLEPKGKELVVGHGMCSGAFRLDDGAWSLELTAVDVAGNSTAAPGGPLRFIGIEAFKPDAG